jgi:arylformamidase
MPTPRRVVDLTHVVEHAMTTYPGLPGPELGVHLGREESRAVYAPGTEFEIGRISMVANTGTYLDAPRHRFADGADLADVPLARVAAVPGLVVDVAGAVAAGRRAVGPEALAGRDVAGRAVLVRTGWDVHWRTERYGVGAPYLTADAATLLADAGAALVGIDSVNVDDTSDGTRPAHTVLLAAQVAVVEHLTNLAALPPEDFEVHAAPVPVRGLGTFPVRAYAVVAGGDR